MFQGAERIDPDSWTRHTVSGNSERFLKIRRVDAASDAGSYICKGINGFGTSSFEFVVDVRGAAAGANGDQGSRLGKAFFAMVKFARFATLYNQCCSF